VELLFERIEHPRIRRRNRLFSLDFVPGGSLEHLSR